MVRGVTDFVRQRNPFVPDPEQNEAEQTAAKRAWTDATRAQACDAVRPVLPCSTQSTVGIVGTAQAIDNMIMRLASEEIQEFQELASNILKQVREVALVFFVRTDLANRGGAKTEYRRQNRSRMQKIATRLGLRIPVRKTPVLEEDPSCVSLLSYTPSDETSLAADCLYDSALDSSHEEIQRAVRLLTHNERGDILRAYIGDRLNRRHKPGRAFEKAHYEWEILGDYGTFRDLQRHRMVDDMRWPELTPNYGFAVPQLVIEAGYQELFNECFGISYDLYWNLRFSDDPASAQYAVLLGHLMRYKFIANARESYHLHELRTTIQGHPGYRRIVFKMHEKIQEIHPIIGGGMIFVGQKDTPELIRLDSALAIERKLAML
jgi:thymidylate synthase ThyX